MQFTVIQLFVSVLKFVFCNKAVFLCIVTNIYVKCLPATCQIKNKILLAVLLLFN